MDTYLVKSLYNMGQVNPGSTRGQHLVKEIVLEELQEVPVTRLRPLLITSKSRGGQHQRVWKSGGEESVRRVCGECEESVRRV